ncbi:hypothetical protein BJX70DRAFT_382080 [Aspergillus crustosus]
MATMSFASLLSGPRQRLIRIGSFAIIIFFVLCLFTAHQLPFTHLQQRLSESGLLRDKQLDFGAPVAALELPPEYTRVEKPTPFCADRFGVSYLTQLRDSATEYCTTESASGLTCFHSITSGTRVDSFCLARGALYNPDDRKFTLGCNLQNLTRQDVPRYTELTNYWYGTGPGHVLEEAVTIDHEHLLDKIPDTVSNYTLLVKREGSNNTWHSLMEVFSMTLSLDVLRITQHPNSPTSFFTTEDIENTQVLILDDLDDGHFLDLWSLFAHKPFLRMNNPTLLISTSFENIIIPLSGGGNPFWQGDWDIHICDDSPLLRTFFRRVLNHFHPTLDLDAPRDQPPEILITFINRTTTRRLINADEYLDRLRTYLPHTRIQSVDFAAISFSEQLAIAHQKDVLVGVHGAGLTHGIFLPPDSAMVEILPWNLNHKGFRNVAALLGHTYFSVHASKAAVGEASSSDEEHDWHGEDVFLDEEMFMELMNVAVKSMYNKGSRNYDVR